MVKRHVDRSLSIVFFNVTPTPLSLLLYRQAIRKPVYIMVSDVFTTFSIMSCDLSFSFSLCYYSIVGPH